MAKALVAHGDITSLSIFANQLVKKGSDVLHGAIREVSLVLAGANPGATIDFPVLQHSDGSYEDIEDEAIISYKQPLSMSNELAHYFDDEEDLSRTYVPLNHDGSALNAAKEAVADAVGAAKEAVADIAGQVKDLAADKFTPLAETVADVKDTIEEEIESSEEFFDDADRKSTRLNSSH